ncbi:transposase [Sphaerospermopsis sp. FACHB-1194]|uniref:transposase n=1 Tax=Sphaerospermopsis sp. FACHB-1194 TaxID=2692862 RepID=UPI0016804B91|nr:transposase [Sphaerospermopsis sp. FACHB-1194]MBD2146339.1 transposase [Sphaerospermopsis sp. FACHB-1194]
MSKAYPSNLTRDQYELISDLIPEPKPRGRKREVNMWEVLNAIFYILVEGVRWRALPGEFPPWHWIIQVVLRPEQTKGFTLLKKRWVVERTYGWLMGCRRLVRDYELLPETSETFIYLAMIRIMVRRLA